MQLKKTEPQSNSLSVVSLLEEMQKDEANLELVEEINSLPAEVKFQKVVNLISLSEDVQEDLKEKIDYYKEKIEQLEKNKQYAKVWLRNQIGDNTFFLEDVKLVPYPYIKRDVKPELLSLDEFTYDIKGVSRKHYKTLLEVLADCHTHSRHESNETVFELMQYIEANVVKNPFTVSKLPEDHPAIYNKSEIHSVQIKKLSLKDLKDAKVRTKQLKAGD